MAVAAQAGFGLTRVVLLVGTGMAGSVVFRNGRLSEVITEIQVRLSQSVGGGSLRIIWF